MKEKPDQQKRVFLYPVPGFMFCWEDFNRSIDQKSNFSIGIFSNKYLMGSILAGLALQLVVVGIPAIKSAFHLEMPDIRAWGIITALVFTPLVLNEFMKFLYYKLIHPHSKKVSNQH